VVGEHATEERYWKGGQRYYGSRSASADWAETRDTGVENARACETSLRDGGVTWESRMEEVELRRALAKRKVRVGEINGEERRSSSTARGTFSGREGLGCPIDDAWTCTDGVVRRRALCLCYRMLEVGAGRCRQRDAPGLEARGELTLVHEGCALGSEVRCIVWRE
jgi:hypothetical protein